MPIYEYMCNKCSECFSLLQRAGITEKDTICPKCGSKDVKKRVSIFSCSTSLDSGSSSSGGSHPGFSGGG
jgi:putative FmdB family regulatory protein